MVATHSNDIKFGAISLEQQKRRLSVFNTFVRKNRSLIRDNAEVYANKRARKMPYNERGQNVFMEKILIGATFVPAYPGRYEARGKGRGRKFKYFVFHRPGGPHTTTKPFETLYPGDPHFEKQYKYAQKSSSLRNTVLEFAQPFDGIGSSSHFIIGKSGELIQMVDLDDVAFHVKDRRHPFDTSLPKVTNDNAVGVELEGPIFDVFTEAQLQKCAQLLRMMHDLYGIPLDYTPKRLYVFGHDEEDRKRKKDPWRNFPYERVLKAAQSIQAFNPKTLFQPPLDITGSTEALVAQAKRDALTLESGILREVATIAADRIDVDARASRRRGMTRDQLMQQRSLFSDTQEMSFLEYAASFSKSEDIHMAVVVNPPKCGTLFNWITGLWEDVS